MSGSLPGSGASDFDPATPGSGSSGPPPAPVPPPGEPALTGEVVPPPAGGAPDPAATPIHPVTPPPYPVTGAPYPVTGVPYPVTAPPYGLAPPSGPRRSPWLIVLGILSGVLLLASGALGTLYYLHRDEARRTSADQQAQIAAMQDEIAQLNDDLDEAETRLRRAEDDLADAQACPDAVQAFIDLAVDVAMTGESELPPVEVQRLVFEMVDVCGVSM